MHLPAKLSSWLLTATAWRRQPSLEPLSIAQPATLPWPLLDSPAVATALLAKLAALPAKRCLVQRGPWAVYVLRTSDLPQLPAALACQDGPHSPAKTSAEQPALDDCYRYLVLYDWHTRRLGGVCRLGHGKRLLRQRGRAGFALAEVCKLKRGLQPVLRHSLEISLVALRPGGKPATHLATLLWAALGHYLRTRPRYRYLLGSVCLPISLRGPGASAAVAWLRQHCLAPELAADVYPRAAFGYQPLPSAKRLGPLSREQLLRNLLASRTPGGLGVPLRLRPYFQQRARLLALHRDPRGSEALHGVVLLDASHLANYAGCPANTA